MRTITISDETASFIETLVDTIETQDSRGTASPIFFTICKYVDVCVPEGCGDKTKYFDHHDNENYSEEQAKQNAEELEMDFDEYVNQRCTKYDVNEEPRYEGFFLTLDGYNKHVQLNGHNIERTCNSYNSYVDHVYRNPEIEGVLNALKEIRFSLKETM